MPEILKKVNGEVDWNKLFMGFAVALVFIMQQYHAMQVADLKSNVVPRAEYEIKHQEVMDKDIILAAIKELHDRIDNIDNEVKDDNKGKE